MLTSNFDYELPDHCIARYPTQERDGARMLVVRSDGLFDDSVRLLPERISRDSLVVVNDTRVRRARLLGHRRSTGGRVELLLLERADQHATLGDAERWLALARPLNRLRTGESIDTDGFAVKIVDRIDDGKLLVELQTRDGIDVESALEKFGHVPIPPYLRREDELSDVSRYQTVYAKHGGSVAAPTAGLHLTEHAIETLRRRGVEVGSLTLHVGIGTFRPVTADDLDQHPMHTERFEISADLCSRVEATRAKGGRVIAIGTTTVRALESAADATRPGMVRRVTGATNLLIQPGYSFRVVDGMLTNFHQPRSTLLALVAAAVGLERTREAYRVAVQRGYRFLSYGDAMWIPELIG